MPVQFEGRGFLSVVRGALPDGDFVLTLDPGLIGNAGAISAGPPPPPDPDVRTLVLPIGGPILSGTAAIGVGYQTSPLPGVGATEVHVVTTNNVFISHDPKQGFFIVVWRGQGLQAEVS